MNRSQVFAYIRVSTAKQGERGVSLQEQQSAIEHYAATNNLEILRVFEERQTAAKRGRPVFVQMLKRLKQGEARGVVIHKIDRSARNLRDWADLGELLDGGTDVHFANEGLDLHSRGGRLSADIQAVVAADFIRNLREETRKGFYGRLKQGLYPLMAPIGYIDCGKGKPKAIDPDRGPIVRRLFELYATQQYSLDRLLQEAKRCGLTNRAGGLVSRNGLSRIFHNSFYFGLIRLAKTGEAFAGAHEPLISRTLFDRVQAIMQGKATLRLVKHDFTFRKVVRCRACGRMLIGELQKGQVYYRCHTKHSPHTSVREDVMEQVAKKLFVSFRLPVHIASGLQTRLQLRRANWSADASGALKASELRKAQIRERLGRLTDAFIDQVVDRGIFEERKALLLSDLAEVDQNVRELESGKQHVLDDIAKKLELASNALLSYETGFPQDKRDLIKSVTSNCLAEGNNVEFEPCEPFTTFAETSIRDTCDPSRATPRTLDALLDRFIQISTHGEYRLTGHGTEEARIVEVKKQKKRAA